MAMIDLDVDCINRERGIAILSDGQDYQEGYDGDAARITQAGELRSYARAAWLVISDEISRD